MEAYYGAESGARQTRSRKAPFAVIGKQVRMGDTRLVACRSGGRRDSESESGLTKCELGVDLESSRPHDACELKKRRLEVESASHKNVSQRRLSRSHVRLTKSEMHLTNRHDAFPTRASVTARLLLTSAWHVRCSPAGAGLHGSGLSRDMRPRQRGSRTRGRRRWRSPRTG